MVNKLNKQFYNTVLSQCFSPCKSYLAVGDIYGCISIFYLNRIVNTECPPTKEDQLPKHQFTVKEDIQINSLITVNNYLLVGTVGEVTAYSWKAIKSTKDPNVAWTIEIPTTKDTFDKTDINCMVVNEENNTLYVGCGDDNVYVFDIENRLKIRVLQGHEDYIHCLCKWNNDIITGSEDGKVIMWDLRTHKQTNMIEPHTNEKISRPNLGKWVGAVGLTDDWLICGGGPRLSLWHYRFLNNSTVFPIEDEGIHVATIDNDRVFAGGRSKLFYQMSFNGDIITEIQTSAVTAYSAIYQEEPSKVLSIAGSSPRIDISTNFMYRDLVLTV